MPKFVSGLQVVPTMVIAFLIGGAVGVGSVHAQNLTSEQLARISQLTPEQRQRIIRALGDNPITEPRSNPSPPVPGVSSSEVIEPVDDVGLSDSVIKDRLGPHDSLVIELTEKEDVDFLLQDVRAKLGSRVYQLDHQGYLIFPGVGNILLAGLSAIDAELRLSAVPELRDVEISVYLLTLDKVGNIALEPFGSKLFSDASKTIAPNFDIPVPMDYIVGPGDELSIHVYGQQNADYNLIVGRDGKVKIPDIGPVAVAGMRFDHLQEELVKRIEERYIGVGVSLTMGVVRSIQIFVLGDVNQPGSYTVSSLSTMTNALMVSGGVARSGSMRNVQLKRKNRVVGHLDLYDLLLNGNTKNDRRVRPGDVIYVPPVGAQIAVHGEVNRPAIYEVNGNITLHQVLDLAGGVLPSANRAEIELERFENASGKSVQVLNLNTDSSYHLKAGDQVAVSPIRADLIDGIFVRGNVLRETTRKWFVGARLLDVIPSPTYFKAQSDQNYLLIRREHRRTGQIELLSADWRSAFEAPFSDHNIVLQAGDVIHVFSLSDDRAAKIAPLIEEAEVHASSEIPSKAVVVNGRVRAPGTYPWESGMTVKDLIRAAGATTSNAYLKEAELTRTFIESHGRDSTHIAINLENALAGGEDNQLLQPYDVLTVKEIPLWRDYQNVEVTGEVRFPGIFSTSRGERISQVIERAGGLTNMAFLRGAVFLREDLKERERIQLERLVERVRTETLSFDESSQAEPRERAQALLEQLSQTEAVGRLVINLESALRGDPEHDVVLEDGDRLIIPPISQEITVIGEVQYPTSHIYESELDQFSYLFKSGGATRNADLSRLYVIRAGGDVIVQNGSRWFRRSGQSIEILPGDTIVVPFDADRISRLTLWSNVSQVVYNIGVAAAAVASF